MTTGTVGCLYRQYAYDDA